MQYHALLKNSLISEQKIRKVANDLQLVRKPVSQVLDMLSFMPKKGAKILAKVLSSAIANAENNGNEDRNNLIIQKIQIDRGMRLHRMHPRARGRSAPIIKRRSHVSIVIGPRDESI